MKHMYKRAALKCAKSLRVEQTAAEKKLWSRLRNRALAGLKFRRQQPIGRYIVDFFCAEKNLVIELDGVVHLYREDQDKYRQTWLESEGFSVLRFLNTDICQNIEVVLEEVLRECDDKLRDPHPNPSPLKGEGLKSET